MDQRPRMIVLCADDFALSPGISQAIAGLIERGRLSATSCMAIAPDWPRTAALLKPFSAAIDIGLHLTLTALAPLAAMPSLAPQGRLPSLSTLMRAAVTGRLHAREIGDELRRQVDAFITTFQRKPDFIDGHQHVHVLPTIRDETLALFRDYSLTDAGVYLRVPWEDPRRILRRGTLLVRSFVIAGLALPLAIKARASGLAVNEGFGGVRDFDPNADYRRFFQRTLAVCGQRPIVMCHPGRVDDSLASVDSVTAAREQELSYFAGNDFPDDLAAANCRLCRFRDFTGGAVSASQTAGS